MKTRHMIYIAVLIFSVTFLFIGNRIATGGVNVDEHQSSEEWMPARVTEITEVIHEGDQYWSSVAIEFNARITRGARRGEIISATQNIFHGTLEDNREVEAGNRVILVGSEFFYGYYFTSFERLHYVFILGAIFVVLMILFGGTKGVNAIISLGFIGGAVFLVFIPAILAGRNIYITTIIISIYAIVATMLTVVGANKKSVAAIMGCLGGVLVAGVLMRVMDAVMVLSGFLDRDHGFLASAMMEHPLDLRAVIFAGVTIGILGAVMDVALSIASSLWEVKEAGGGFGPKDIFKSGINIGRDIVGTMLNTLILAYIGSSLAMILLIATSDMSMLSLFNWEMVLVELLRALIGSFGLLLTVPLTAGICAWLYTRLSHRDYDNAEENDPDDYFQQIIAAKNRRS